MLQINPRVIFAGNARRRHTKYAQMRSRNGAVVFTATSFLLSSEQKPWVRKSNLQIQASPRGTIGTAMQEQTVSVREIKSLVQGNKKNSREKNGKTGVGNTISQQKGFSWRQRLYLLASGAVMGLLNGFFGGGGGMVCVPILQKVLGLDSKHSHATAIAVILPLSLISAAIYVLNGYIQSFPLVFVGGGVLAGGILGSYALKWLPPKAIRIIFALIMLAGGIKLIL